LTHAVELGFGGPARTDQYLYTTSSVTFKEISIVGNSTSTNVSGDHITPFGFSSALSHFDGTAIRTNDIVGALRFGGFDGYQNRTGLFNIGASASEDWAVDGNNTTTNAGVNWSIACQPAGIQLTTSSIIKLIVGGTKASSVTPTSQPTMILKIGSGVDGLTPQLISSDGIRTYTGHGRTDVNFFHSRITQIGVTTAGPADNPTITGTNIYSFFTTRQNAADISSRQHLHQDDSIGIINFSGAVEDGSSTNAPVSAEIRVSAVEEFTTSTNGSAIIFLTAPRSTSTIVVTTGTSSVVVVSTSTISRRLTLTDFANTHISDLHSFVDNNLVPMIRATTSTISLFAGEFLFHSTDGITFPDGSNQASAFSVAALPPISSSSTGTVGQIAYDMGYVYICVGTNNWRRFAATTF
jgi:hypothetical protein